MWSETAFSHLANIKFPIIQAPMMDIATTQLVASVSNAHCLGMHPAGYLSGKELKKIIRKIRALTTLPFGIHVQLPSISHESELRKTAMYGVLQPVYEQLGLKWKKMPKDIHLPFTEQMEVIISERVPLISFANGLLDEAWMARLKESNITTIGYATSKYEAKELQQSNVDAICLQGMESGGDRHTFLHRDEECLVPLDTLISDCNTSITKPLIAYGDSMNGSDIKRCLQLGASAVQMGSSFITTDESGACDIYKKILMHQKDLIPTLSRVFTGKLSRFIPNALSEYLEKYPFQILEYPVQQWMLSEVLESAKKTNNPNFLHLCVGTHFAHCKKCSAKALLEDLLREIQTNH
ncbi:MAG: nitronate monooxygenase [Chlamydiales bacterium]|nr:nitronate monooxygenase [Chlamydiales bacterium]